MLVHLLACLPPWPEDSAKSETGETGPPTDSDSGTDTADSDTAETGDSDSDSAGGDADGDGYAAPEDCDDGDAAVSPAATEVCDGVDNDCDGDTDGDAVDPATWYADADRDGAGDPASPAEACTQPEGHVADGDDCDDGDASVSPAATEVCDGVDQDCDGEADDEAVDPSTWYADADGDGFGDEAAPSVACDAPPAHVATAGDCDDADPSAWPGADEACDGVDDDCDGVVDDGAPEEDLSWQDADGDGYGDPSLSLYACGLPAGFVADASDCDDTDAAINPGAADSWCDGVDDDCSGDEAGLVTRYDSGVPSDLSSSWAAGSASAPAYVSISGEVSLVICPGDFYVEISNRGDAALLGLYGADLSTLRAGDGKRVVLSTGTVDLEGLRLVGSSTAVGGNGGVLYTTGTSYADGLRISGGSATYGGAWACDGGTVEAVDVQIEGGVAEDGGAVWVSGGWFDGSALKVGGASAARGGAFFVSGGASLTLADSLIDASLASEAGGAIWADDAAWIDLAATTVSGSSAPLGGGAHLEGGASLSFGAGSVFSGNAASTLGGGLHLDGASASCSGSGGLEGVFDNDGCGLGHAAGASFSSALCDWDGTADNRPADVCDESGGSFSYGDDADFSF